MKDREMKDLKMIARETNNMKMKDVEMKDRTMKMKDMEMKFIINEWYRKK